ncbi:hypothetical protein SS1G_03460 [Sclerotinia sclerotiorum 1980 UF-70]|uniref:Uncharacterized protein n=2 Tax=Sclerotinia sclerotiorum (strain ATCC 18683 / 1980 / Ss-1) TaxID=665079 RepID=A0A1D9Q7K6_SCLS1|nr:hypothetical protein SS1G_03460 [Sclerotinia sclerotiorum 1980 UF-70]APA10876.1 hypothetical protein sscle_07g056460 [Sclerotinia sclerotiorum 1980 UF-70]EDO00986.1 hypothetical protein SS1G_03460 [Sclerotinia sclerotiorum 1980 UF-70]
MAHLIRLPLSHSGSTVNSPMSIHQHHLGQGPTSFFPPPTSSPGQYKHHSPLSDIPISPPHTRSASAENTAAQLIEDFRRYSHKLRDQYEGERAHILADRQRAIEVIAEERELWEKERGMLISRIRDLENRLVSKGEILSPTGVFNLDLASFGFSPAGNMFTSPTGVPIIKGPPKVTASPSGSGSTDSKKSSHGHQEIKQESGRNADGSPFYAPAPQNPTRTFSTESESLRVEDIHAPRQTPIQVIQELTPSDFVGSSQYVSPEVADSHHFNVHWEKDGSSNGDIIGADSIDISQIAPHLEGVPIKASAVDPVFVAQVLSPRSASPRLSPNVRPPGRDIGSTLGKAHLESENKRLTMYAGHTPNHSISRFSDLVKESQESEGDETPRGFSGHLHRGSLAPIPDEDERLALDGIKPDEEDEEVHDRPLTGLLGLTNVPARDEIFLEALTEKLEEVKNSRPGSKETSPSASVGSLSPILEMKRPRNRSIGGGGEDGRGMEGEDDEDEDEDEPVEVKLKLKSSINFGRPMGFR